MPELKKKLTLYGLTMIAVGSCIGSGIFVTPASIVSTLPHHGWVLIVWALGGLIALTGALTFAELGGLFPKAGGVYVFLKEAYGRLTGFLYGWVILLVINTGALAALGLAFADYMTFFIPDLGQGGKVGLAAVTILGLTAINITGVSISQIFANTFTSLKLLAIAGIIVAGIAYFVLTSPADIQLNLALGQEQPEGLMGALLLALIGVLWSFGGWHHASYLAGEAIDAPRTVPRAMILGALIVTLTYVLVNLAYMLLLPLPEIAGTERVAGDAVMRLVPYGGKLVAVIIAISIFGTIGIYTMTAPRIYYAMARDGIFFKQLAEVHPRFRTPVNAMVIQAVWAVLLLLFWGTFYKLITYVTFMDIAFMTMAGVSVIIFRQKLKDTERPYKVVAYPVVPLIFISISGAFVISTIIQQPTESGAALILLALGVLAYQFFEKQHRKEGGEGEKS
ncbi:MAG: amino acid permease [Bacteroidota bacterium]